MNVPFSRSAFPSFSDENDSSLSREEKLLIKSRDDKLGEQRKRFDELNEEKRKLQEELMVNYHLKYNINWFLSDCFHFNISGSAGIGYVVER